MSGYGGRKKLHDMDHYFLKKRKIMWKGTVVLLMYSMPAVFTKLWTCIIGYIVAFLAVYTFEFIYVMFALSITIWISKKHVDFCNKDAIWNGSQLGKKERKKDKSSKFKRICKIYEPFQKL